MPEEKDKSFTPSHSNMDIPNPVPVTPTTPAQPGAGHAFEWKGLEGWWNGEWDTLENAVRKAAREEFEKLKKIVPDGPPFYIVEDRDIDNMINTLALGPWQRQQLVVWLDHLKTGRREVEPYEDPDQSGV